MAYDKRSFLRKIVMEAVDSAINGAPKVLGGGAPPKILGGANAPKILGGGLKKAAGNAPQGPKVLGANKPQQAQSAQPAANGTTMTWGVTKKGIHPQIIRSCYENFYETQDPSQTDKEVLKVYINYIADMNSGYVAADLNKNYPDIIFAVTKRDATLTGDNPEGFSKILLLIARPGKTDEFKKLIPYITDLIWQSKQSARAANNGRKKLVYDPDFKDEFKTLLMDSTNGAVTEEEKEEVKLRIAETWMELLSDLKNPETQRKIGSITGIISSSAAQGAGRADVNGINVRGANGFAAGHQLSYDNKVEIFLQDPNATCVFPEETWRKFGHEVIDKSKWIMVTIPSWKSTTKADKDKAAQACGYQGGWDEVKMRNKRGELSVPEVAAVKVMAQYVSTSNVFFYAVKEYDVANTRVINGQKSTFLPGPDQVKGLENNLLGIPNAAAGRLSQPVTSTSDDGTANTQADTSTPNERIDLIRDAVIAVIRSEMQSSGPNETGDPNKDIVNFAYSYAEFLLGTSNISKPETQEAFKQSFAASVAAACGVNSPDAANYLANALANRGKDSTLKQMVITWYQEYKDLMKEVKKEVESKMKVAAKSAPVMKNVVEETIDEYGVDNTGIRIASFDEFGKFFGLSDELYEEQEDLMPINEAKNDFFTLLDKMDGYGRY